MEIVRYLHENNWAPHPAGIPGVEMNTLRSKQDGGYHESIAYVKIAVGAAVPPHVHETEDDNLLIMEGCGMMRVGEERFQIKAGAQITVPANIEHEIYDITEEVLIYDVFAPPAF